MVKIIGYAHKVGAGNINGVERKWDNYCFDCITDTNHDYKGLSCLTLKVKSEDVVNIFGVTVDNLDKFVNQDVVLNYIPSGKYPVLDSVVLADKK